ncbi:MAG: hypothetical protein ACODAQ_10715, partial [Phycisphaeraceae bacterium]
MLFAPAVAAQGEADALDGLLTPSSETWETPPFELDRVDGQKVIVADNRARVLTHQALPEIPFEVTVRAHLGSDQARNGALAIMVGEADAETRKWPINAGMSILPAHNRGGASLQVAPHEPARLSFHADGIGARRLNWPEEFRRIIEHTQAKLAPVTERWFDLRLQVREGVARLYFEDRLVGEQSLDAGALAGPLRVRVGPNIAVARIDVSPLASPSTNFEPLPLRNHYNTSRIAETTVAEGALSGGREEPIVVDGVPFHVEEADDDGDDHIDLGTSWVPTGRLAGHFPTRGNSLSGRWLGALADDGMRIQMAIPSGRYQAVHLLAAAEEDADELPIVTAQFYRNQRGFPQNFTTENVPGLFAQEAGGLGVKLANGREAKLYKITIPVEPGRLAAFDGVNDLELELTKQVKLYRAYPDPFYYTYHGAGLPSSVHVFAVTLERPTVELELTPGAFADAWAAPDVPSYEVTLRNQTGDARQVQVKALTASYLEGEATEQTKSVSLPADGEQTFTLQIQPPSHGYHDLTVELHDDSNIWREKRGLVYLHEDTRERGDWQPGRGPIFGFWNWRGGHETPSGAQQTHLMGLAGAESSSGSFEETRRVSDEEREAARKWGMITFKAFGAGDHYITAAFARNLKEKGLEAAKEAFVAKMESAKTPATDINRPELMSFFPEPHIGPMSYGTPPQYFGDPPRQMSEHDEARFQWYLESFIEGATVLKEHYPNVKPMLPHGDPMFAIPFVQRSEKARELFEGIAVDIPVFERLPEQQVHQVSLHRMYFVRDGLNEVGITDPTLAMYEGPSRSAYDGALSDRQLADFSVRDSLLLFAYGVGRQMGGWAPFESASFWGEQHYG